MRFSFEGFARDGTNISVIEEIQIADIVCQQVTQMIQYDTIIKFLLFANVNQKWHDHCVALCLLEDTHYLSMLHYCSMIFSHLLRIDAVNMFILFKKRNFLKSISTYIDFVFSEEAVESHRILIETYGKFLRCSIN